MSRFDGNFILKYYTTNTKFFSFRKPVTEALRVVRECSLGCAKGRCLNPIFEKVNAKCMCRPNGLKWCVPADCRRDVSAQTDDAPRLIISTAIASGSQGNIIFSTLVIKTYQLKRFFLYFQVSPLWERLLGDFLSFETGQLGDDFTLSSICWQKSDLQKVRLPGNRYIFCFEDIVNGKFYICEICATSSEQKVSVGKYNLPGFAMSSMLKIFSIANFAFVNFALVLVSLESTITGYLWCVPL